MTLRLAALLPALLLALPAQAQIPTLQLNTTSLAIASRGTYQFSVSGGIAPYSWSLTEAGSGNATLTDCTTTTCNYQAGLSSGTDRVQVTSFFGLLSASATITVGLSVTASSPPNIAPGESYTGFSAINGVPPYTWSVSPDSQGVSIDSSTGDVTTTGAAVEQAYTVTVTDSVSDTTSVTLNVTPSAIEPATVTIAQGDTYSGFTTTLPVTGWSISPSDPGVSIDPNLGVVTTTATATVQTYYVTAMDPGGPAFATLTVNPALTLEPASISISQGAAFDRCGANGGVPFGPPPLAPYTWSISPAGAGVTISSTGAIAASSTAVVGPYTVIVADSLSNQATATLTIAASGPLILVPSLAKADQGQTYAGFASGGGNPPYSWTVSPSTSGVSISPAGVATVSSTATVRAYTITVSAGGSHATATLNVNKSVTLAPATATIVQGQTYTFTLTGGTLPRAFSIAPSGAGVTISASGVATASATATLQTYTVTVTDAVSGTASSALTVNHPLLLTPATFAIALGDTYSGLDASGGVPPYTWAVSPAGTGVTVSTSGAVTATSTAMTGAYTVSVSTSGGAKRTATFTVDPALMLSSTSATIAVEDSYKFTASGGVPAYSWSVSPSGAGVTVSAGKVTASTTATPGSYTVTLTDAASNQLSAGVTVNAALSVAALKIDQGDTQALTVAGGVPGYTCSISPSGDGVTVASCIVTATATATLRSYTVTVTDALSNTATGTVKVSAPVVLSPSAVSVAQGTTYTGFAATLGTPPYTFSVAPTDAGVTIAAAGGHVTISGTATIQAYTVTVTDAASNAATARLDVGIPTVAVGAAPWDLAFDGTNIWAIDGQGDTLTKIRASTHTIVATYTLSTATQGDAWAGIVFDGANIWVSTPAAETVSEIDAATGAVVTVVNVPSFPEGLAFDGTNIWVVLGTGGVLEINAVTYEQSGPYPTGDAPARAAFDGTNIWVTNFNDSTVTELVANTGAVVGTYPVGGSLPFGILFDGTFMWVSNSDGTVSAIKYDGLVESNISVGSGYGASAMCYDGSNLWVPATFGDQIYQVVTSTGVVAGAYAYGNAPYACAFDGKDLWVANSADDAVADVNLTKALEVETEAVTASGDGNETILSLSGAAAVIEGGIMSYLVTPQNGAGLSSTVGGTCPAGSWSGSIYTTGAVTAACTVVFGSTLTVTPSGTTLSLLGLTTITITPSTPQTVNYGGAASFQASPSSIVLFLGEVVTVGGSCPGSWNGDGDVYTTGAVTANCTVDFSIE